VVNSVAVVMHYFIYDFTSRERGPLIYGIEKNKSRLILGGGMQGGSDGCPSGVKLPMRLTANFLFGKG
jgi:hypothetical protein